MKFIVGSDEEYTEEAIDRLWGSTLKELLLAESDDEFNAALAKFKLKRDALGYRELMEKKYRYVIEAKEKLGLY